MVVIVEGAEATVSHYAQSQSLGDSLDREVAELSDIEFVHGAVFPDDGYVVEVLWVVFCVGGSLLFVRRYVVIIVENFATKPTEILWDD